MESPNKWGDNAPTRHVLPLSVTFTARNELCLVELLTKGAPKEPPNNSGCCQGYCSPETDSKTSLLKTTRIYLIKCIEAQPMPD